MNPKCRGTGIAAVDASGIQQLIVVELTPIQQHHAFAQLETKRQVPTHR
jgi:hypothetical protein